MKNKFVLSFCINLLIGILFSFPLLSDSISANSQYITGECFMSGKDICNVNITDGKDKLCEEFPANDFSKSKKSFRKQLPVRKFLFQTGYGSVYSFSPNFLIHFPSPPHNNLQNVHADISHLKELKITKMLC